MIMTSYGRIQPFLLRTAGWAGGLPSSSAKPRGRAVDDGERTRLPTDSPSDPRGGDERRAVVEPGGAAGRQPVRALGSRVGVRARGGGAPAGDGGLGGPGDGQTRHTGVLHGTLERAARWRGAVRVVALDQPPETE